MIDYKVMIGDDYMTLIVEKDDVNTRLDIFVTDNIDEISRNSVQKLLQNGNIKVNGEIKKSNYKLKYNDLIEVYIPEAKEISIIPENIPLDIFYEDKEIIIVNKPKGMVVHPANGHFSGTLVNALLYHCAGELSGINGEMRPGIVHRIDKDTSGLLMVAKTNFSHQFLAKQLEEHSITRKYNAVVFNKLKEEEGTINAPIGRSPKDRKKMAVTNNHNRHAVTHYKVIEHLGKFDMVELQLETGRTHQIRVHMSYIGHPLLGDEVYGTKKQPFKLEGQVLHAKVLGFIHPVTKKYLEFEAPLPEYFEKLLKNLRS